MSQWQLIFSQSRVNGAIYRGEILVPHPWAWPKKTWFQRRLAFVREAARQEVFARPTRYARKDLCL
jgi:hypothetical protein